MILVMTWQYLKVGRSVLESSYEGSDSPGLQKTELSYPLVLIGNEGMLYEDCYRDYCRDPFQALSLMCSCDRNPNFSTGH